MNLPRTVRSLGVVALALALSGCAAQSAATDTPDCQHWCGHASAQVTFQGQTTSITGGGCYDEGIAGVDVRIGDWQEDSAGDYLTLTGYPPGERTPAATAIPTDDAGNPMVVSSVSGNVDGTPFTLDAGAQIVFTTSSTGSFSGIDVNGYGPVSGTFTCG